MLGLAIAALVVGMIGVATVMAYGGLKKRKILSAILLASFLVMYVSGLKSIGDYVDRPHPGVTVTKTKT